MVGGKTAALLGCCMKMGAILGQRSGKQQLLLEKFGSELGLAFQIQDDCLGLWGIEEKTGKSVETDLVAVEKRPCRSCMPWLHRNHLVCLATDHSHSRRNPYPDEPSGRDRFICLCERPYPKIQRPRPDHPAGCLPG